MKLFLTGFMQVFFVVANTYFISKGFTPGILVASFFISIIWSWNVKRIAFGDKKDRMIYSLGAMCGSYTSYLLAQTLLKYLPI